MRETWWCAPPAEALLASCARPSVAGWMALAAQGATLSTDRDAAAVRWVGPTGPVLLKWRAVRPAKRWKTWGRASRERAEAWGALAALRAGIEVPPPWAVGERRDGWGRLLGAVLLRPWLEGFATADQALAEPRSAALLTVVAQALARWHALGYRHGDCWPKNLLVSADGARVVPIGAPRARVVTSPHRLDRARLMDLARLAAGLRILDAAQDPLRFLPDYEAARLPGQRRCLTAARRLVEPLLARVLAKRAEDERTRPVREPHGPPLPVPLAPDARAPRRSERPLPPLG